MENATKALLIAAGMLLAVMLISMLVMGYNRISSHYKQQNELLVAEQLDKFNKQFQNYNRSDIRGNELISLMNKVIDYNVSQSYQEGTGYEPIKVTITIGDDLVEEFRFYNDDSGAGNIVKGKINNTDNGGPNYSNDRALVAITNTPATLISEAATVGITNLTDTQLQKLTAEISNIIIDEDDETYRAGENRRTRAVLLRNILKLVVTTDLAETTYDIKVDKDKYYITSAGQDKIEKIKEIVSQYYQYTQFKRACFDCVEMTHNTETGRVNGMKFEVQTKEENGVTTVVFD